MSIFKKKPKAVTMYRASKDPFDVEMYEVEARGDIVVYVKRNGLYNHSTTCEPLDSGGVKWFKTKDAAILYLETDCHLNIAQGHQRLASLAKRRNMEAGKS
jgi:hypothetical protein